MHSPLADVSDLYNVRPDLLLQLEVELFQVVLLEIHRNSRDRAVVLVVRCIRRETDVQRRSRNSELEYTASAACHVPRRACQGRV